MVRLPLCHPSDRIRVLVAENSVLASQLMFGALQRWGNKFHVRALAGESSEVLHAVREYSPQVALISIALPDGPMAGLNVVRDLRTLQVKTGLIMLLDADTDELVLRAFQSGARGIFCRGTPLKALPKCIRKINEGQVWASTEHMQLALDFIANLEPRRILKKGGMTLLSPREQEVACLVAEGMSNQDIAKQLKLCEHTVRNYIFHIFNKLGLSSRVELALYALSQPETKAEEKEPQPKET